MPELTDEEFFALIGFAPKRQDLEGHVSVPPEVSELPSLVNADGSRYPARKTALNVLLPAPDPIAEVQATRAAS